MKVQLRRKRGRPKRRWLDSVRDHDIKENEEKGHSVEEVFDHTAGRRKGLLVCHRTSTRHKSGNKMRKKKKKKTHVLTPK